MDRYDLVKTKNNEIAVVLIPSSLKRFGTGQFKSLNLIETESGVLKAMRDEELELIQLPIEE